MADRIAASAAIPIAFDPIYIDGCMYVDAGLRQHVVLTGEFVVAYIQAMKNLSLSGGSPRFEIPLSDSRWGGGEYQLSADLLAVASEGARQPRMDIIVNGEASISEMMVDKGLRPIVLRAIPVAMHQAMWSSLDRAAKMGQVLGWPVRYRDASEFWLTDLGKDFRRSQAVTEGSEGATFSLNGTVFNSELQTAIAKFGFTEGSKTDRWRDIDGPPDPTLLNPQ